MERDRLYIWLFIVGTLLSANSYILQNIFRYDNSLSTGQISVKNRYYNNLNDHHFFFNQCSMVINSNICNRLQSSLSMYINDWNLCQTHPREKLRSKQPRRPIEKQFILHSIGSSTSDDSRGRKFNTGYDDRDKVVPKFTSVKKSGGRNDDKKRALDRVLYACRNKRQIVTLTEMNLAITTAGRLERIDDALEIFKSIRTMLFKPDLMSYNNIIWAVGHSGNVALAAKLFNELMSESSRDLTLKKPNVYTYGALMHGFARTKDYKNALYYLDIMTDQGITPNLIVFTSAIEACSQAGEYKEALGIITRMKEFGMRPDVTMINAAIKACSVAGAMDEAELLAESLREDFTMDVFTYHTLMMGHTKLGRFYKVLALYEEAIQSTAKLDGGIFSLAMLAALNSGMSQLVPRIADKARYLGIKLTEASYTTLIQAYAESGGSEQAVQCLDHMVEDGLQPNVISFGAAIDACRDKPNEVLGLLQRMSEAGIETNTVVLSTAINSMARAGASYTEQALNMLKMMEEKGPEPNLYTYNTVTRAFAESGKLEEAIQVVSSIKSRGFTPDHFTFTTLLIACGRSGHSEKVEYVMDMMKNAGIVPDAIAYGAAIDAHRRNGDSSKALSCLQDMIKYKIEPTASHYNLVLRSLRSQGLIDKMVRMLLAISVREDAKINGNTFELVIEALLEQGDWKQTLQTLQIMERFKLKPSLSIYVSLVGLLEKARQYKAVLALYRIMTRDGYDFYENSVLNEIFKRLVNVAARGVNADLTMVKMSSIPTIESHSDNHEKPINLLDPSSGGRLSPAI